MLFIMLLFNLFSSDKKKPSLRIQGYVDDRLLIARVFNEKYNISKILPAFAKVEKWGQENGITFDVGKFKAIHFSQRHSFKNLIMDLLFAALATPDVKIRTVIIVAEQEAMRWLKVFFDP